MPFSVNNIPCVDPDTIPDRPDECNSYSCPVGYEVGFAKVLMWRSDYMRLGTAKCTLRATDGFGRTVTVGGLYAIGIGTALQTDHSRTDSVSVVTLADLRWKYRQVNAGARYNYRDSAGAFITATTNTGTPWTWQEVVNLLWGKLTAVFGSATAPLFPTTPSGTPEGFDFTGRDVWWALNRVVNAAGFVIRFDPTTGTVGIVDPTGSAAAPIPTGAIRTFDDGANVRETEWGTTAGIPAAVTVAFPVVNREYPHTVDSATVYGTGSGTKATVWDDLPAFSPTNDTALSNRAAAVRKLWERDALKTANRQRIEFVGWQSWVTTAVPLDGWSRWSVYDRGCSGDGPGGVLTCVSNLHPMRLPFDPTPDRYLPAGGGITTANVDGTEESTTTRLEFDQVTGIRVDEGATDADPDVVSINIETLVESIPTELFDETIEVPTCLSIILTKTFAATQLGGQDVLTNVTAALAWKTKSVSMLRGTAVSSPSFCVAPDDCCPSGPETLINTACCLNDTPENLTLTISGTGGGSFPITHSGGNWDTGTISLTGAGAGTMTLRLYCFGSDATGWTLQNNSGSPDYTIGTPTYVTRECDPFIVVCTATLSGGGSYNGETRTFTITY